MGCLKLTYNESPFFGKTAQEKPEPGKKLVQMWLSVDPKTDKYPSMSPYMYCAGNPVRYVDPNGMEFKDPPETMEPREKNPPSAKDNPNINPPLQGGITIGWEVPRIPFPEVSVPVATGVIIARLGVIGAIIVLFQGDSSPQQKADMAKDSGKNEKHGDGGRAKTKAEQQIQDLEAKKESAPKKERQEIDRKIKNIRENAARKAKGEEHSRSNKK